MDPKLFAGNLSPRPFSNLRARIAPKLTIEVSGASKAAVAAVEAAGGVVRIPTPKADAKKPTKRAKRARAGRVFARAMIAFSLNGLLTNDGERSEHPRQYNVHILGRWI